MECDVVMVFGVRDSDSGVVVVRGGDGGGFRGSSNSILRHHSHREEIDDDPLCVSVDNDHDDDFDIVLNSNDCNNKRANGSNLRTSGDYLEDEDNACLRSQSAAYGSDLKGIGCMQAAYWQQLGLRSLGPQSAPSFSLPRARNILDVNIDVFEQKPWRHPGADITDYFNFGFDEDSWKLYCKKVDEYRHRGTVSSGTPPSEAAQSTEVDVGKGQAIEVEDSIFERQSSMDIKIQPDRDSDAMQITILDPEDPSVPEASNHGDDSGDDDVTDHLSFSSATDETIKTSNDTKESNLVEESVEEEKSPGNHSKSFKINSYIDRRKANTHDRCLTELTRSMKPDYHHSEDSNKSDDKRGSDENRYHARRLGDINRKHGDHIYHERNNNPVYKNRTHKDFDLKILHEHDYIISRRLDKRKSFDSYEDNISYSKSKVPSDYYGERFGSYEDWDAERFGSNMDQPVSRYSEDVEYYDERKKYVKDNKMRDWVHNEKGQKRNKGEIDDYFLDSGYYDDTHGENFRPYTNNERKRYDIEYTRWEFRGPGRNKKTVCSFELDNSLLKRDNVHSFASRSSEESDYNDRWHDNMMPKSNLYRRHGSYERQRFEPLDRDDYMIDIDDRVDMRSKRCHWQSEIEWEDEFMFRHEDAKFYAHKSPFPIEKVLKRERFVSEHDPGHAEELIDDPYVVYSQLVDGSGYVKGLIAGQHATGHRYYEQESEVFSGNKYGNTYGKSRSERLRPPWFRNSHLLVGAVKSSKKHKKPKRMDLDMCLNSKVGQAEETKATDELLDMEEGQILTKVKVGPVIGKTRAHVNGPHNQNGKPGLDNTRILEAMAKMEKRRARFNEPNAITRKDSDSSIKVAVANRVQETGSNKQQRPARKRRWGASGE
ncbi:uncharacterized protein LOC143579018 [Bidens hawaiensis]|uniref:uncharacterized protein LOC143579018 n=1 Tax=Bidens hawaiensis TaxID=980011 RepID=UPI0040497444